MVKVPQLFHLNESMHPFLGKILFFGFISSPVDKLLTKLCMSSTHSNHCDSTRLAYNSIISQVHFFYYVFSF